MSGGSMDYLYQKLDWVGFNTDTPERAAFRKHLALVAKALHDIEWVDSSDYGPGDESEAIRACLSKTEVLDAAREKAEAALQALKTEIERSKS